MRAAGSAVAMPEEDEVPRSERGPAPTRVVIGYGFWLFLLSDIVMFAALFAAYTVLHARTAGGPSGHELFDRKEVLIETLCLLLSSFTCGLLSLAVDHRHKAATYSAAALTFMLGAAFLYLELGEFTKMIQAQHGPDRSAFLSAFFALVGMHGLHVAIGLLWLLAMMLQVSTLGWREMVSTRLLCFSLFWHALDIVWIGVFTIVYLGTR